MTQPSGDNLPIVLLPGKAFNPETEVASPYIVQDIGTTITRLAARKQGMPITAEVLAADHPGLDLTGVDEAEIVGRVLAPDRGLDEVVKLMAYNRLGRRLLATTGQNLPGFIKSEIKLTKDADNSRLRALLGIISTGELMVSGHCYVDVGQGTSKPSPSIRRFAEPWGLAPTWDAYMNLAEPGQKAEFNFSADRLLAGVVKSALTNMAKSRTR
jgi:hypothetical protein